MLVLLHGCESTVTGPSDGSAVGTGRFGPEDRLAATVVPGRFLRAEENDDDLEVHLQAASPTARLALDNGNARTISVRVRVDDLLTTGLLLRRLEALPDDARREIACAEREPVLDQVEVAPLAPLREPPARVWADLLLPACSRLVLEPVRPQRSAVWRTLVVPPETSPRTVAEVLQDEGLVVDHVLFFGGQTTSRGSDPLGPFLDARESLNAPITWVADRRRSNERANDVVRRRGPGSFVLRVEDARILILETTEAGLGSEARTLVNALEPEDGPEDVVVMAVPPALPGIPDRESFDRVSAAARLIESLADAGFRHAFVLGGTRVTTSAFGPLSWFIYPRGGSAASEPSAWRIIEIHGALGQTRPCSEASECGQRERCVAGRCRHSCESDDACDEGARCHRSGLCARPCAEASDCDALGTVCEDRLCAPLPVVRVRDLARVSTASAGREVEAGGASD